MHWVKYFKSSGQNTAWLVLKSTILNMTIMLVLKFIEGKAELNGRFDATDKLFLPQAQISTGFP